MFSTMTLKRHTKKSYIQCGKKVDQYSSENEKNEGNEGSSDNSLIQKKKFH